MKWLSRSTYCSVNTQLLNMEYCRERQKRRCWIFSRRQGHKLETHFSFLSATFSSSLRFPSFLLTHSISPDNTALIIAELHRDNCSVESRAAAAEAVWENPCCLLQPADCARFCVLVFCPSCTGRERQGADHLLHHATTVAAGCLSKQHGRVFRETVGDVGLRVPAETSVSTHLGCSSEQQPAWMWCC